MPLVAVEALVLHAFPYGESSKIARLLTREYGVQSVIAKGALRRSPWPGLGLQVLSQGIARFYWRPHRDLHTLADYDVQIQRPELARDLTRFGAAMALVEVVLRFAPTGPHAELFAAVVRQLDAIAETPGREVAAQSIAALWSAIAALGFAPNLRECARDGAALPSGSLVFSVVDGGFLCPRCAAGSGLRRLPQADRAALERFVPGRRPDGAAARLSPSRAAAHRRLLVRFVQRHLGEQPEQLRALAAWQHGA